jgi:hypothetical protein
MLDQRQSGKDDPDQTYNIQLEILSREVGNIISQVDEIGINLSDSYSEEGLANISRIFETINTNFTNYVIVNNSKFYEIIHRSESRLAAVRSVAKEAKAVAQLFERYSEKPKSYSAVNSRLQINKLRGELTNLLVYSGYVDIDNKYIDRHPKRKGIENYPDTSTKQVEIILDGDAGEFTLERQQEFVRSLASSLNVDSDSLRILKINAGSIVVVLEMSDAVADRLYEIASKGNFGIPGWNIVSVSVEGRAILRILNKDDSVQSIDENTLGELDEQTLDDLDQGDVIDRSKITTNKPRKESSQTADQQTSISVDGSALSDLYSKEDLLGYSDYVNALANFIESPKTRKPITIGIDAVWGGGKTTLMRLLEKRLGPKEPEIVIKPDQISKRWPWQKERKPVTSKEESIYTVWFNAWQYDQQETLWAALVLEILSQVQKQSTRKQRIQSFFSLNYNRFKWGGLGWDIVKFILIVLAFLGAGYFAFSLLADYLGRTWADAFEWLKDWVKVFATVGLASLAYTIFKDMAGLIVSPFSLGISRYMKEPDYKNKVGFISQFQEDFRCVIESVTQKGKWPLVVFIDDLDRCSAPKAAEVIEAINLLLDSEHCVFIIGMDSMMLSRSIQAKYKDIQPFFEDLKYSSNVGLGRHFLEKIIQIDFRIPQPDKPHITDFIDVQLGRKRAQKEQPVVQQAVESLIQAEQRAGKTENEAKQVVQDAHPDIDPDVLEAAVESVQERTFEELPEVVQIVNELAYYLNYNPRRIKRFINMYRLQALIAYQREILETTISLDNLACWVAISMRWPEFINSVLRDTRIISQIRVDILGLERAKDMLAALEQIRKKEKYSPDILLLLTDPEFRILLNKITGEVGDAENYLHLSQIPLTS